MMINRIFPCRRYVHLLILPPVNKKRLSCEMTAGQGKFPNPLPIARRYNGDS
ncbi:hypothetical protein HMPREF3191_00962 [Veillonellaceae bacterium DNF00626]|nr:hypothetical protein HMPREF3191_00962 [Veillonellaceae bacterium DNF00626]